jgi:1-pyrroline-5-carboxylate dehydrogenase
MANGIINIPAPINEPVRSYAPGSPERESIKKKLEIMYNEQIEIPVIIGGKEIYTGKTTDAVCPFEHKRVLAKIHQASATEVQMAIDASQEAWKTWSEMRWQDRAAVFLKAADLLAGPWRDVLNAATMLNQAKTIHQAEIDAPAK